MVLVKIFNERVHEEIIKKNIHQWKEHACLCHLYGKNIRTLGLGHMEINSQMETTDVTMKGWVDIKKCLPLMRRKLNAEKKNSR